MTNDESSASNLDTVFFATPVIRKMDRIERPATRALTTATRCSLHGYFMLTIMLERLCITNIFSEFSFANCQPLS